MRPPSTNHDVMGPTHQAQCRARVSPLATVVPPPTVLPAPTFATSGGSRATASLARCARERCLLCRDHATANHLQPTEVVPLAHFGSSRVASRAANLPLPRHLQTVTPVRVCGGPVTRL